METERGEQSKFFTTIYDLYKYMEERSIVNEYDERQYRGSLVEAYKAVGGHMAWYSDAIKLLQSPDLDPCVVIQQRGNPYQQTITNLHHPPPPGWGNFTRGDLTDGREAATMLLDAKEKVERLETWRESLGGVNLAEVLRNFETRITRLENKTGDVTGKD